MQTKSFDWQLDLKNMQKYNSVCQAGMITISVPLVQDVPKCTGKNRRAACLPKGDPNASTPNVIGMMRLHPLDVPGL